MLKSDIDLNSAGLNLAEFAFPYERYIENFYRIKGLASCKGDETQYVVQFVNGKFEITPFSDCKRCDNFLVFIGRGIEQSAFSTDLFRA